MQLQKLETVEKTCCRWKQNNSPLSAIIYFQIHFIVTIEHTLVLSYFLKKQKCDIWDLCWKPWAYFISIREKTSRDEDRNKLCSRPQSFKAAHICVPVEDGDLPETAKFRCFLDFFCAIVAGFLSGKGCMCFTSGSISLEAHGHV